MLVVILSWEFGNETGLLLFAKSKVGSGLEREDIEHDKL